MNEFLTYLVGILLSFAVGSTITDFWSNLGRWIARRIRARWNSFAHEYNQPATDW